MSEPENFIARWSRRKREAAEDADTTKPAGTPVAAEANAEPREDRRKERNAAPGDSGASQPSEAVFDITKLPPIETITAESDIRPFLAPGVPTELTRAALRRAWATDPKIRDFVGLSENSWDFNAPDTIAGFGPLEMTDELRAQVARMMGAAAGGESAPAPTSLPPQRQASSSEEADRSAGASTGAAPQDIQISAAAADTEGAQNAGAGDTSARLPQRNKEAAAAQNESQSSDDDQLIAKRTHGRALPE